MKLRAYFKNKRNTHQHFLLLQILFDLNQIPNKYFSIISKYALKYMIYKKNTLFLGNNFNVINIKNITYYGIVF